MEEALDLEIAAFSIDIDKIEAAIKQHMSVANDQLKKVGSKSEGLKSVDI